MRRCDLPFSDVVAAANRAANTGIDFVPVDRAHFFAIEGAYGVSIGGAIRLPYNVACGIGHVARAAPSPYLRALGCK